MRALPFALAILAFAPAAHASSHAINIAPVRGFVQNNLISASGKTLKLGRKLNVEKPGTGITPVAVKKAIETQRGLAGYNSGRTVGNYVVKMGNEKLIMTAMSKAMAIEGVGYESKNPGQLFELRTGKTGLVIARGTLDHVTGELTFRRSHNEHSPATPAERSGK